MTFRLDIKRIHALYPHLSSILHEQTLDYVIGFYELLPLHLSIHATIPVILNSTEVQTGAFSLWFQSIVAHLNGTHIQDHTVEEAAAFLVARFPDPADLARAILDFTQ